ncbi:MAG TPA: hypothetical protein VHX44_05085 [Planctomycetota bacterium]|nr:hypothetical protein [Planctomycetota bacterium]
MRPDMHHLLVERGHAGRSRRNRWTTKYVKGWASRCRFRNAEDEPAEALLPLSRGPAFSENLSPLRRYLEAQVGRPWDTVYAEIRAHVNADTAVQYHILQHFYDRFIVHTWADPEGRLWHMTWSGPQPLDEPRRWPVIYVCPRTGLLRRTRKRVRTEGRPAPADHLPGSDQDHEFRQLCGQWYEVWWGTIDQGGTAVRAIVRKRQLGYKELRNLGLRD